MYRTIDSNRNGVFGNNMEEWEYSINILDQNIIKKLPKRPDRSNKGTFGKVLCIAGSRNMAGAAYLCAYAAYRAGAGLVRILTPEENRIILQGLIPEAVLSTFDTSDPDRRLWEEALDWADAVAFGPGLSRAGWAAELLELTMERFQGSLVVDADGLNLLSGNLKLLKNQGGRLILTPHVGEFSRLTGKAVEDILKNIPEEASKFAARYGCVCVLKDAPTAVGFPDGSVWINTTGNNGMSTGGSGDVLTGIVAGLLGQRAEPFWAALLGVWLHGRAGDLAAEKEGRYGLMARHLIEYLPEAMRDKGEKR